MFLLAALAAIVVAVDVASYVTFLTWTAGALPQNSLPVLEVIVSTGTLDIIYRRAVPRVQKDPEEMLTQQSQDQPLRDYFDTPDGEVGPRISSVSFAGASAGHMVLPDLGLEGFYVVLPLWIPVAILAIYPAASLLFRLPGRTMRYRRMHGLCLRCGYDLTGNTSGKCPECATPVQKGELL